MFPLPKFDVSGVKWRCEVNFTSMTQHVYFKLNFHGRGTPGVRIADIIDEHLDIDKMMRTWSPTKFGIKVRLDGEDMRIGTPRLVAYMRTLIDYIISGLDYISGPHWDEVAFDDLLVRL